MNQNLALELTESGLVPDSLIRHGIRKLLKQRLDDIEARDIEKTSLEQQSFIAAMDKAEIALLPELANEQHYEVPESFYSNVLGAYRKYSCCYWSDGVESLSAAEETALRKTCQNAEIEDGMKILELGCGWGSLTLWMASQYPNAQITAVSNSSSQGEHIRNILSELSLNNVEVLTEDMNDFETGMQFDRVVSIEMFEHMRNHRKLMSKIANWLKPEGKFFMHIFVNRAVPYLFEDRDASDWMSRYFFSGGMMPSDDLPLFLQDDLSIEKRWRWNGEHYKKTAEAWLANIDAKKKTVWPILIDTYGEEQAEMWFIRWRIFFMAVAELFGYDDGNEWYVSHYLFQRREDNS